ncbi:hypothetical protein [Sporomusa sp.]|uniref:hypothetical protein n=1 Tax=Sporomusa sp. TaxID=2078658 RepID=UPI002B767339|nr:hypothetical protein [Sporomusa sp.]HWR05739.1 hypothetical protein [Sporomusa sp.]
MKKRFVTLFTALATLSMTASGLAAAPNPFGDVPANHWSYAAIDKLADAGLIDGSGDNAHDQKIITRYEMAGMIGRAMWNAGKADADNKALIEKLSQEFTNELEGLRVIPPAPKAEKKTGSIAVSGDARVRWIDNGSGDTKFTERLRLNLNATVNEDTGFYGRIMALNHNEFGTYKTSNDTDRIVVTDAAFTTKNFYNSTVTVGRFTQQMDPGGYWMNTVGGVDGIKIATGKVLKMSAGFANFGPYAAIQKGSVIVDPVTGTNEIKDAFFVQAEYPLSPATTVGAWWFKEKTGNDSKFDVKSLSVTASLSSDVKLLTSYGENAIETNRQTPAFYHLRLTYGAVSPAKPGSWSLAADYRKFEPGVNNSAYTSAMVGSVSDVRGWALIGSKAIAKNAVFSTFYGFNTKKVSNNTDIDNFTRCQIDYNF